MADVDFRSDRRFKITAKGIADNESFRRKINRWLDGTAARFPWDPQHNATLDAFAQRRGESLTAYEVWEGSGALVINVEESISKFLKEGLVEEVSPEGIAKPSLPSSLPLPQTYGDWVNIAEDIKEKYPDDPVMRASVNFQLGRVARETEEPVESKEERLQEAQEAKRWLAEKAGELGIR